VRQTEAELFKKLLDLSQNEGPGHVDSILPAGQEP
jgi:hypothetical protein